MKNMKKCAGVWRYQLGLGAVALGAALAPMAVKAQATDDVVRIGVLADMSGLYSDMGGQGITEAVKFAIEDVGGTVLGKKIEMVSANHSAKADTAATRAREWFDTQGVDMIISGPSSGTSLAVAKIAAEKKKVVMVTGGVAAQLTNEECSPYTVHYLYDTVALARGTGAAMTKQGGKTWYFLTVDYAFGDSLEKETTQVAKASGQKPCSLRFGTGRKVATSRLRRCRSPKGGTGNRQGHFSKCWTNLLCGQSTVGAARHL